MEVRPIRVRRYATIYIKEGLLDKIDCVEFQKLLVHELCHLIYDPIAEEHELQTRFDVVDAKSLENKERFVRQLERAVEHTARMLTAVLPLKCQWGEPHPELLEDELW